MPAQVVDELGALRDEPLAVIDEQPDIELGARQLRDGKGVEAFADRGSGDRDGVDHVVLAALARGAARVGHQLRRDAHDPLAAAQQEALQRPDTWRQSSIAHTRSPSRPRAQTSRSSNERRLAFTVRSASTLAVTASTAPTVCECLWVSAPITIICTVPSLRITDERIAGGHISVGAMPRSY